MSTYDILQIIKVYFRRSVVCIRFQNTILFIISIFLCILHIIYILLFTNIPLILYILYIAYKIEFYSVFWLFEVILKLVYNKYIKISVISQIQLETIA